MISKCSAQNFRTYFNERFYGLGLILYPFARTAVCFSSFTTHTDYGSSECLFKILNESFFKADNTQFETKSLFVFSLL